MDRLVVKILLSAINCQAEACRERIPFTIQIREGVLENK